MSQTNTNREKKIRSILERSSNIDAQILQKYVSKKLSKEELHEVEKQLLNSDFAAEAVEGFENADFKVDIVATTRELNKEIKNYNKERGFYKTDYRIFYAAASVALLFVVLFGLFRVASINFSSNDLATMETKSELNTDSITNGNLALNEQKEIEEKLIEKLKDEETTEVQSNKNTNNIALNQDKSKTRQDFSTSDIWITKREQVETKSDEITNSSNSGIVSSPIVSANRQMSYDSIVTNTDQLADDDYTFFSEKDKKSKASKKSQKDILFNAMQSYENKKYTEANLLFDSYLVSNPNDAQALYFGGMSYYENHDYKKTIPLLEKFLTQKNSQDAEWYLANSYLKINQQAKAKSLLQKIANSNSQYSNQAKSLLKK
jgi:hypothetical protein